MPLQLVVVGLQHFSKTTPPPEVIFEKGVINICKFIKHLRFDCNEVTMHGYMSVLLFIWCILSENLLIITLLDNKSNQQALISIIIEEFY